MWKLGSIRGWRGGGELEEAEGGEIGTCSPWASFGSGPRGFVAVTFAEKA